MGKTIFTNYVIRPWTIAMVQCFLLAIIAAICTAYFSTLIGLAALSSVVGLFIFQRKIRRLLKQRGCDTGTVSEADSETYLFRGEDGSELRVPKNSRWIFVERKGDKVERIYYNPSLECVAESGIPAPEIKSQGLPNNRMKALFDTIIIIAGIILVCRFFGDWLPLIRVVYHDPCKGCEENCLYESDADAYDVYSE